MQKHNFIFEIGVEEIPAQYVESMAQSYLEITKQTLIDNLLDFDDVLVKYSPRRLTAIVSNLSIEQKVVEEEVKGPSLDRAYVNGEPTPALLGFLKGKNKTLDDIIIRELNGAKYVYVLVRNNPQKSVDVLSQICPQIINKIYLPNAMRWADYKIKFVRPIKWLLALFGSQVVDFSIECCQSSNFTMGHRTLSNNKIVISNADEYSEKLKENYIILDSAERERIILSQIKNIENEHGVQVLVEKDLLDEIVNLVEYPTCAVGSFPSEFLSLPDPVVITPMKDHQRYFPVYKNGKLDNKFVFVRNGNDKAIDYVIHGNERVLIARLKDGEFFYNEDIQNSLYDYAKKLDQVMYQEKLGSMLDKSKRVNLIAKNIAGAIGYENIDKIDELTTLYKADLVSKVVGEFSELQGVMGAIYARLNGVDEEIATAIGEQYLPISAGGELPQTRLGTIIAIADKLDSIMGLSSVGLMGKGSLDPYGMRRQTLGILAIQEKFEYNLDFKILVKDFASIYEQFLNTNNIDKQKFIDDIVNFFAQRIKVILTDEKGIEHSIIDQIPFDSLNIFDILKKVEILKSIQNEQWFSDVKQAFLRIQNILKNKDIVKGEVQETHFDCEDEKALYNKYLLLKNDYQGYFDAGAYIQALNELSPLSNLINAFFDNNLVLSQDKNIYNNRLVTLNKILKLYTNIFILV